MGLSITFTVPDEDLPPICPHCGSKVTPMKEVFWANITHNLNQMADNAGLYDYMWTVLESGLDSPKYVVPYLKEGLRKLRANPDHFRQFEGPGIGDSYEDLVAFVEKYIAACEDYPDATIDVSR